MENKDLYFQKVRGIAIIAVVLIHALGNATQADVNTVLILRQIINFPVAVFFFVSGYFVKESAFEVVDGWKRFITKRLFRILVPYFIWSIVALVIIHKFYYNFNVKSLVKILIMGQALFPYYFMIVMVQLILITPIVVKISSKSLGRKLLWLVTPISLLVLYVLRLNVGYNFTSVEYALPFTMWFVFYYYGIVVGNSKEIEHKTNKNIVANALLCIVFLVMSVVEAFVINNKFNLFDFATSQIKLSTFIYIFFLINVMLWGKTKFKNSIFDKVLVNIGNVSFGVYLIHIFILNYATRIGVYILKTQQFPIYFIFITTIVTLILSYVAILVVKNIIVKFSVKDSINRALGF